ncbi:PRC-barrel domain-containing protein [Aliiroseovarius sp. PTFE2010]|uniref:PRC-barrel domain-containing protein n=1 Tax=Aliiroseovarius sp. PTFE2010 TaxID=3417190 RepID=UPI003CE6D4EA
MKFPIIAASAIALSTAAYAETHSTTAGEEMKTPASESAITTGSMIRARDLVDAEIYTANTKSDFMWDYSTSYSQVETDWNEIGEIEDLVMDENGKLVGLIAEVGGFLDLGDKHVMVSLDEMKFFKADNDGDSDWVVVTGLSEEQLEERENIDEGFWE